MYIYLSSKNCFRKNDEFCLGTILMRKGVRLQHPKWTTLIRWYVSLLIIGVVLFKYTPPVRNNTPACRFIRGSPENRLPPDHPWSGITLLLLALVTVIGPRKWNESRTLAIVFWIAWFSSMGCGIFWLITAN